MLLWYWYTFNFTFFLALNGVAGYKIRLFEKYRSLYHCISQYILFGLVCFIQFVYFNLFRFSNLYSYDFIFECIIDQELTCDFVSFGIGIKTGTKMGNHFFLNTSDNFSFVLP